MCVAQVEKAEHLNIIMRMFGRRSYKVSVTKRGVVRTTYRMIVPSMRFNTGELTWNTETQVVKMKVAVHTFNANGESVSGPPFDKEDDPRMLASTTNSSIFAMNGTPLQ